MRTEDVARVLPRARRMDSSSVRLHDVPRNGQAHAERPTIAEPDERLEHPFNVGGTDPAPRIGHGEHHLRSGLPEGHSHMPPRGCVLDGVPNEVHHHLGEADRVTLDADHRGERGLELDARLAGARLAACDAVAHESAQVDVLADEAHLPERDPRDVNEVFCNTGRHLGVAPDDLGGLPLLLRGDPVLEERGPGSNRVERPAELVGGPCQHLVLRLRTTPCEVALADEPAEEKAHEEECRRLEKGKRAAGVSEAQLRELAMYQTSSAFSPLEKLVIEYAATMTKTPVDVPEELFAAHRCHFDDAQLVELTAAVAWENYRARFNHALLIEAEGFSEGAYCPLPERPERER